MITSITKADIERFRKDGAIQLKKESIVHCIVCNKPFFNVTEISILFPEEYIEYEDRYYILCSNLDCEDKFNLTPYTYICSKMMNRFHREDTTSSMDSGVKLLYEASFYCSVCKEALGTCEDNQSAIISYLFPHEFIQVGDWYYTLCGDLSCREIFELSPQAYLVD